MSPPSPGLGEVCIASKASLAYPQQTRTVTMEGALSALAHTFVGVPTIDAWMTCMPVAAIPMVVYPVVISAVVVLNQSLTLPSC